MGDARPGPGVEPGGRDMGRDVGRHAGRDVGAAALEFALVSPLLFGLLFMIFSAGWGLWEYEAARATAREAVRLASVGIADQVAFTRGVACLGERNGMRPGALSGGQLTFHSDPSLTGLLGTTTARPGGYVEVRLTFVSALGGAFPSPFTDDQGRFSTGAVSRIEQLGPADLHTDAVLATTGVRCS